MRVSADVAVVPAAGEDPALDEGIRGDLARGLIKSIKTFLRDGKSYRAVVLKGTTYRRYSQTPGMKRRDHRRAERNARRAA